MIATVVLTFSRTGWLVLFIELLLLSVFYYQVNVRSWLRKYWWIFIWLAMVIIFYWFTLGQTNFVTSSNEARLAMIERSWQLFLDHPLIGNGVGTWQAIISNDVYYVYEFGQPLEQHGVIWKLLAEQGIVGLAVWLGVAAYLIYLPWRRWRQLTPDNHWRWPVIVAWLVIIGQFIFQLFDTGYYSAKMWLPVGLAMVLLNFARENNNLSAAR
jgi:O-antigen ligase